MLKIFGRLWPRRHAGPRAQAPIAEILNHQFSDGKLLSQALTHRSFLTEIAPNGSRSNERMEFLGDAVIELVVVEELCRRFPDKQEGELSKIKAMLVSGKSLQRIAADMGLGPHIRMSDNEARNGGRHRGSILEDTLEAVVAAIYLDAGMDAARKFVIAKVMAPLEHIVKASVDYNFKSQLLEYAQARGWPSPVYRVVKEDGPDHAKTFAVEVSLNGKVIGRGTGSNKKTAQQQAAQAALLQLND